MLSETINDNIGYTKKNGAVSKVNKKSIDYVGLEKLKHSFVIGILK
jgi:hypothetical protein